MATSDTSSISTARQILESNGIVTYFQPILSARQRSVIGAEALSRGLVGVEALSRGWRGAPPEPEVVPPACLFKMAAEEGLRVPMDRLCRATAVRTFARIARNEDLVLFLNVDVAVLETDSGAVQDLLQQVSDEGLSPRNVAIEILESAFEDTALLREVLNQFRSRGFLLVLDDVGTGHSNLDRVPMIKPDVMKLDRSLVSGLQNDYHRQEAFKSLVMLGRRIGALVVAEGVETQEEAIVAMELGADLLQGFFLGRPEKLACLACPEAAARIEALARQYKTHMITLINRRKLAHRRFNIVLNEILVELSKGSVEEFDCVLSRVIGGYDKVECVYVLDEGGMQVSSTVLNPGIPSRAVGVMFRPAPKGADHSLKEYYYVLLDVELHKYTTDPYVSLATGNLCRTISTYFRDSRNNKMYILCIDVLSD